MTTPEYPRLGEQYILVVETWPLTLLMFWKAEVAIPSLYEYHVVGKVLPLNLGFLKYYNVGF